MDNGDSDNRGSTIYIYIYTCVRIASNSLHEENGYEDNIHVWKVVLANEAI